ncbi:G-alpha-domain-containing protein [Stereum hirsutum FP-91666 SS1]|uniref:G-alpha-domain-containing protein n=1 Tax=Stereum hirsutum (strain FP-91666) TaxID=721885 RepID=UPI0004449644|nr:G-alpha-domain-containing protein [Stereum hirsutum FP-91666 SS1]EIM82115.1 G-alpha-domain-containing protein [Stereum hirsutum FP-91666 SS1]
MPSLVLSQTHHRSAPNDREDPLAAALRPPPNESEDDRAVRLQAEEAARIRSEKIDEEINQERLALKKGPKPVKLLLLGQSESGKSTTLKNFQLLASPKAFKAERAVWRSVIQLNVVRSIHLILDIISQAQALQQDPRHGQTDLPLLTPDHLRLKMRLSPLLRVEEQLVKKLSANAPASDSFSTAPFPNGRRFRSRSVNVAREMSVNSNSWTGWKGKFKDFVSTNGKTVGEDGIDWGDPDDPGRVIHLCGEDMIKLWTDPVVRELLEAWKVRLQEMSGFFLDELERVAEERYVPTDDDIMRARIKTLGVSEHRFALASNNVLGRDWLVYDVGGHRSCVTAWVPFFDDMDAIIFLAPISCFDQVLEEDENVNRLEDSVLLWKMVVANPLLNKTNLILFLNKCDIMKEKLASGVRFGRFITSYGDRLNDFEATSAYLRRKFASIFKEFSQNPRPFYCHFTCVTDTKATSMILVDVTDVVLRDNLDKTALII